MCKAPFTKVHENRKDLLLAMLDLRNTPSEGFNTLTAQRLMGRWTRTLLPTTEQPGPTQANN